MALGVSNALRRVSSTSSRSIPSCGMAATEVPKKIHATDRVGGIMKQHEAATCSAVVDAACPVCIRLDGNGFSRLTRGFDRPYDVRIHHAMVGTAADLLERFGAASAYTMSDEISLLFAPHTDEAPSSLPFSGRVQKLVSVLAGYASARFNAHLVREPFDDAAPAQAALRARVERCEAHFDARVFSLPSVSALVDYVRWRALLDCRRNSISMLAQAHFTPAELHGVDSRGMLALLSERRGVEWSETPPFFRYGTTLKKEVHWKRARNPKTGEEVLARRTRVAPRSFEFVPEDASRYLLARTWPDEGPGSGDAGSGGEPSGG